MKTDRAEGSLQPGYTTWGRAVHSAVVVSDKIPLERALAPWSDLTTHNTSKACALCVPSVSVRCQAALAIQRPSSQSREVPRRGVKHQPACGVEELSSQEDMCSDYTLCSLCLWLHKCHSQRSPCTFPSSQHNTLANPDADPGIAQHRRCKHTH